MTELWKITLTVCRRTKKLTSKLARSTTISKISALTLQTRARQSLEVQSMKKFKRRTSSPLERLTTWRTRKSDTKNTKHRLIQPLSRMTWQKIWRWRSKPTVTETAFIRPRVSSSRDQSSRRKKVLTQMFILPSKENCPLTSEKLLSNYISNEIIWDSEGVYKEIAHSFIEWN